MPTTPFKSQPTNLLALLLGGALLLSLGLNGVLLTARPEPWPDDDDALAATTADLHLTQRLLAQCQQQQLRQDSLRAHNASATLTEHQSDFSSAQ
ncbi:hypothetical protein [Hymenobacter properus]|uniref:Uncharacterized protein n=1 Tax=Hymenobacter properus TaxID=2791026 RepID=A0A931FHC2_9BACT|nr:hypothetical protein [Hymenobacter properus]MBF9140907.1 hypothetical protein [Hymenobacter properus]MBR7719716.1 hypothetical protein [Microvirga sp. SRT04]